MNNANPSNSGIDLFVAVVVGSPVRLTRPKKFGFETDWVGVVISRTANMIELQTAGTFGITFFREDVQTLEILPFLADEHKHTRKACDEENFQPKIAVSCFGCIDTM